MKEFKTAVLAVVTEDEEGLPPEKQPVAFDLIVVEPVTKTVKDEETGEEREEPVLGEDGKPEEKEIHRRTLKAFPPTDGQMMFMLATMGRGQAKDARVASMVNIMLNCFDEDDQDYFESRLITRDPRMALDADAVEGVFEFIAGEWFGRPTQPQSDSVG